MRPLRKEFAVSARSASTLSRTCVNDFEVSDDWAGQPQQPRVAEETQIGSTTPVCKACGLYPYLAQFPPITEALLHRYNGLETLPNPNSGSRLHKTIDILESET
jgi:hypothetical protein